MRAKGARGREREGGREGENSKEREGGREGENNREVKTSRQKFGNVEQKNSQKKKEILLLNKKNTSKKSAESSMLNERERNIGRLLREYELMRSLSSKCYPRSDLSPT